MLNYNFKQFDFGILILFFLSITIAPFIKIGASLYIGIEDLLVPLMIFRIIRSKMYFLDKYIWFLISFCVLIMVTIAINNRFWSLRDYFEIYKIGKFAIFLVFARSAFRDNLSPFFNIVKSTFIILLVLNFVHYFNVLNYNEIIEPFYSPSANHLELFGLDSLGRPAVRRMLGTMGSPNENALLFLIFFIFFLSKSSDFKTSKERIFIYLAFLGLILTQSRTGFISGVVAYLTWIILVRQKFKTIIIDIGFFAVSFGIAIGFNSLALSYFANTSINPIKNNSLLGRIEVWEHLFGMIKQKPFLGHGPNKDYFYDNNLYAESEYVLLLWRYGIFGIIFYLGWLFLPLYKAFSFIKQFPIQVLFIVIISINATTNSPLTSPKILALYALFVGYFYAKIDESKQIKNV